MTVTQVLTDGSLEGGGTPTSTWHPNSAAVTLATISGSSDLGAKHGQATVTAAASRSFCSPYAEGIAVTTGDTISVGAALKDSSDGSQWAVGIRWLDGSDLPVDDDFPTRTNVTASWVRRTYTSTCPSGAVKAVVLFIGDSGTAPRTIRFDSALLTEDTYAGEFLEFGESPDPPATGQSVVVIQVDDSAWRDMRKVDQFLDLRDEGITIPRYAICDPSCSPSRATLMTGLNPPNHGVLGIDGSTQVWRDASLDAVSLGALVTAGGGRSYSLGKFLHDYPMDESYTSPGWSKILVTNDGHFGWNYDWVMRDGATVTSGTAGTDEDEFHVDWLRDHAVTTIEDHAADHPGTPFLMLVNFQSNHGNAGEDPDTIGDPDYSPAPRHRLRPTDPDQVALWGSLGWTLPADGDNEWLDVTEFDNPSDPFNNVAPLDAPAWFPDSPIGAGALAASREKLRDRVRALQSVGEAVDDIRAALVTAGLDDETMIILVTDNGFHLNEYTLRKGKGSFLPIDVDVRAIIVPPGGVSPSTVDDLVGTADWAPTILDYMGITPPGTMDGRSLVEMIEGDAGRDLAKRVVTVFRDNVDDVDTWDDRLGSGEPPSWDRIKGEDATGNEWMYVSHEANSDDAPPTAKGVLFDLTDDPDCMVNLYPVMTLESRDAMHEALADTRDATGSTARTLALVPLPTPDVGEVEEIPERQVYVQGELLPAWIRVAEVSAPWPVRNTAEESMPGVHGILDDVPNAMYGAGITTWEFIVEDPDTAPSAEALRDSLDFLARQFNTGAAGEYVDQLVQLVIQFRDGQRRQARVRVRNAVEYKRYGHYFARIVVQFTIPRGFWRLESRIQDEQPLAFPSGEREGIVRFYSFAAYSPTAPIQDGILTLRGDIPGNITLTDSSSAGATSIRYHGGVEAGQRLVFDFGEWTAILYADDDDDEGTDNSHLVERLAGIGSWLILEPSKANARYVIEMTTGSPPSTDATAELDALPRWLSAHA